MSLRVATYATSPARWLQSTVLPSPLTAWTIAGWIRLISDDNYWNNFFGIGTGDPFQGGEIGTSNDGVTFQIFYTGNASTNGSTLTVGTWYHVGITYDGTNYRAYLNGVLDITTPSSTGTPGSSFFIGSDPTNSATNTDVAYVKLWGAVLTADEIKNERMARPNRFTNLLAWWPLWASDKEMLGNTISWTKDSTTWTAESPPAGWGARPHVVGAVVATGPGGRNPVSMGFELR